MLPNHSLKQAPFQMAEEFQEADVIWADHSNSIDDVNRPIFFSTASPGQKSEHHHQKESSSPVRIPAGRRTWKLELVRRGSDDDPCVEDDGEMVPPHVTVARRIAEQMVLSVCTGNGRTLKGRDLSEVRNSVLRMTGFLEG